VEPEKVEHFLFKNVVSNELVEQFLDTCDICQGSVLHESQEVLYFLISSDTVAKVDTRVALDHGVLDLLLLAENEGQHFPDASLSLGEAVRV